MIQSRVKLYLIIHSHNGILERKYTMVLWQGAEEHPNRNLQLQAKKIFEIFEIIQTF